MNRALLLRWAKRLLCYLGGMYLIALGVVISARSSLGVSPVGSLANVLYQIALDRNAPSYVNLGNLTTLTYCLYILAEFLLLRRDFKLTMLLQLIACVIFGQLVNLANLMIAPLPAPSSYPVQLIYLLCSIPLVAAGVMVYVAPQLIPMPAEGVSLAISQKTGVPLGTGKMIFDCSVVALSAAVSLLYFHGLVGVREGTVLCAVFVGVLIRRMMKRCQAPLARFTERAEPVGTKEETS